MHLQEDIKAEEIKVIHMICQICSKRINVEEKCTKEISCSIYHRPFYLKCVNYSEKGNTHNDRADETCYFAKCLSSFLSSKLPDLVFYKEAYPNGNLIINDW